MGRKIEKITDYIFAFLDNTLEDFSSSPYPHLRLNAELLRKFLIDDWPEEKIARAFHYLKEVDYLIQKKISGQDRYFLSTKGIEKILKQRIKKKTAEKPKKLKNLYLVIIFDIPEKERTKRNLFREALRGLKFKKLQQSVWITRYDLLKEVKILIKFYNVEPYVRIMLATSLKEAI